MTTRVTRVSLGFPKETENLEATGAVLLAFYNNCWRKPEAIEQRTWKAAAMAVVDTLWSFADLFDRVLGGNYAIAA